MVDTDTTIWYSWGMTFTSVVAKLGNMKKAVDWTVYPQATNAVDNDVITIQSDHRIAAINVRNRTGILSAHKGSGAYFMHLNTAFGATVLSDIPQDVIDAIVATQPKKGDQVAPGLYIG